MNRTLLRTAPAAAAILLLAGCGGHGSTTAAPAPVTATVTVTASPGASDATPSETPADQTSPSETPSESPSESVSSSGTTGAVDVCAMLPAADVSRIVGQSLPHTKSQDTMGQIFGCDYSGKLGTLLQVRLYTQNGGLGYDTDVQVLSSVGHGPKQVSGVGDKAFSMPDPDGNAGSAGAAAFASYGALFGDVYVKIGGFPYVDAAQGGQLADELEQAYQSH